MKTEMNAINKQAHNEVKELLDEYVVSPVKENINESISAIEDIINEGKEDIDSLANKMLTRPILESVLHKKLEEQTEVLEDKLEIEDKFQTSIDPVKQDLESAKILLEKLEQLLLHESNTIQDSVLASKTSVCAEVDNLKKQQETLTEDTETNFVQLLERIKNLQSILDSYSEYIQKEVPEILGKTNELSELQSVKWGDMEVILQKMEDSITSATDRKYKSLMFNSMVFNVVEIVGIIFLIMYAFLF